MPSTLTPAPKRPQPDLSAHLPVLREILEEQRQFRLDQLTELTDRPDAPPPDTTDARVQVSLALAAAARQALLDLDAAIARLDAGRYGRCLGCTRQIGLERLYVIPQASLCIECQRRLDAGTGPVSRTRPPG